MNSALNLANFTSPTPLALRRVDLCLFATFLASSVQHLVIKVYLSAVHAMHIKQGFSDPLVACLWLQQVLRGIKRTHGASSLMFTLTHCR